MNSNQLVELPALLAGYKGKCMISPETRALVDQARSLATKEKLERRMKRTNEAIRALDWRIAELRKGLERRSATQ